MKKKLIKKKQKKKRVKRCKTCLKLCCIYKINDFEVNEISKILNDKDNTKKRIHRAKTSGRIKGNFNENINRIFKNNSKKNQILQQIIILVITLNL